MVTKPEQVDLEIKCPCGGTAFYTTTPDGEPASLIHTLPACVHYMDLPPDEYIRWIRSKIEGRADS